MRGDRARAALSRCAVLAAVMLAAPRTGVAEEVSIDVKDPVVRVRAELDLLVNDAPGGTGLVVLEGGDAFVLPSDLERAGLIVRGGKRITLDDRVLVSLRSLAPAVQFVVDERSLALRITAAPEVLARKILDLRPRARPSDVEQGVAPSAFLDYAADSDLAGRLGLSFQGGGRVGRWLFTSDVNRAIADGRWGRGMSAAVRDDVPTLQRLTVGDTVASSGTLGGGALVGGVTLAREWSLDPYLIRAPYPAASAIVTAPSTLQIYVNGQLVRQQALAPGYWDVANLPVPSGQALVHTVIRDAFGRERTLDNRFYFAGDLLAPGYSDYAVTAGFRREAYGLASFDYGPPALVGRYRYGLADWLTPEGRAEVSSDLVSAGAGATAGTRIGQLQLDGAASAAGGRSGGAGLVGWSLIVGRVTASASVMLQSDRYATLALDPGLDRPVLTADTSLGLVVTPAVTVGAEVRSGRYRDAGRFATAGLRGAVQIGPATLALSGDYGNDLGGATGVELFASLTFAFGRHTGEVGAGRDRTGGATTSATIARPLLRDASVGYRLHATNDPRGAAYDGMLQGQTTFARAEVDGATFGGVTTWHANASGGLVYIDHGVYATLPTGGSFALVDAGVPNVGVTAENTLVGHTGSDGKFLVPELQPYYASRIALVDADIPLEYEPGRTVGWFAPPYLGGAIARFRAHRISAITGQLIVELRGQPTRPANGELSAIVDGEVVSSPITEDGRFFLERMPPGKHVVQAIWGGGSCRAAIILPAGAPPVFDAGQVRCIPDALEPGGRIPRITDPGYADGAFPPDPGKRAGAGGR